MALAAGAMFAGYRIVRLLGAGSMGEVYLAEHPRLPREDALKILANDTTDPEYRQRFIQEADLAARLFNPHIVRVLDRGEFEGRLWIAMDYVPGTDLAELLATRYPAGIPVGEVLAIVDAIADALDYAHSQALLHRDVKPANILMMTDRGGGQRILLSDFGIARQLGATSGMTATGFTVGTVDFASPEQLRGGAIDGRADLYSLAATTYTLLTGVAPYANTNPIAVITAHVEGSPPSLATRRPDLAALDLVLHRGLAKNPVDRFATCRQFATALRQTAATTRPPADQAQAETAWRMPGSSQPAGQGAPPPRPRVNRGRRRAGLIAAGVAVIGALVAGATVLCLHVAGPKRVAGPTLDGTYRFVYDDTKATVNGAPDPPTTTPSTVDTSLWAFRSWCTSTGCMATGTKLDPNNPTAAATPAATAVLHFVDGRWHETPIPQQVDAPHCLGAGGRVVAGSYTKMAAWTLEPQPDGTFKGLLTRTGLTDECGMAGFVGQTPLVAIWTGDAPTGVTIADPAEFPAAPPRTSTPPPPGSPVLDGAYRVDFDVPEQTVNGAPSDGHGAMGTHWFAFRSSCAATRCVATAAKLSDSNQQAPDDASLTLVLQFGDGQWQNKPSVAHATCNSGNGSGLETVIWSLQPQSDGTLTGTQTETVLTSECGGQGNVYTTPMTLTRIGDVPPAVILADPALFLSSS